MDSKPKKTTIQYIELSMGAVASIISLAGGFYIFSHLFGKYGIPFASIFCLLEETARVYALKIYVDNRRWTSLVLYLILSATILSINIVSIEYLTNNEAKKGDYLVNRQIDEKIKAAIQVEIDELQADYRPKIEKSYKDYNENVYMNAAAKGEKKQTVDDRFQQWQTLKKELKTETQKLKKKQSEFLGEERTAKSIENRCKEFGLEYIPKVDVFSLVGITDQKGRTAISVFVALLLEVLIFSMFKSGMSTLTLVDNSAAEEMSTLTSKPRKLTYVDIPREEIVKIVKHIQLIEAGENCKRVNAGERQQFRDITKIIQEAKNG